ncbi:hypothetical protein Dimus_013357 [Dionaea muscipula]
MWPRREVNDANQTVEHVKHARGANHTHGSGDEFAQNPLSLPSGPITRLEAKCFKEALNVLIQGNWADFENVKTKMDSNDNQGLLHVIKAIEEAN